MRSGDTTNNALRTNQVRGLLGEYGIVLPQGLGHVAKRIAEIVEDTKNVSPARFR